MVKFRQGGKCAKPGIFYTKSYFDVGTLLVCFNL